MHASRPLIAVIILFAFAPLLASTHFQEPNRKEPATTKVGKLEIYYVDVEGGAATLIVTPARESILVDAGWAGFEGRDASRIQKAMARAGVTDIDHLVITHYHADHWGGLPELASRVPIHHFYDHGLLTELTEDPQFSARYANYRKVTGEKARTLKPGDLIKLRSAPGTPPLTLLCLASNKTTLKQMRKITKINPVCKGAELKAEDVSDNARSIVLWLRYGNFDFINPGDVTWNIEGDLVCPYAPLGAIDLYQVSHHGLNTSNNPVILKTLSPTVAIINNGARKAGSPETIRALREVKSLEGIYQVHLNLATKPEENTDPEYIANLTDMPDEGHMISVSVDPRSRKFSVTNERTNVTRSYSIK